MSKTKRHPNGFTPGPWEVERHDQDDGSIDYAIWNHSAEHYTRIATVNDDTDDANAKANSHVMAAAPDLYEALNAIMGNHEVAGAGASIFQCTAAQVRAARAALAKARGEQP